jgi:Ca-activated chloride channel family protein
MRRLWFRGLLFIALTVLIVGIGLFATTGNAVRPADAQVAVTVIAPLQPCLPIAPMPAQSGGATSTVPICPPPSTMPPLPPVNSDGVLIRSYKVSATITDQIAVTQLTLDFINLGNRPAEGSNLIPLPIGAAVSNLSMIIDGQTVQGQLLDANQARNIYQETVRRLRDPALLQYVGQGAIQANVFPIPPGQNRTLQITYSQVLAADNGLIGYSYPLRVDYLSHNPVREISFSVDVVSSQNAIGAAYSPDATVLVNRTDDHHLRAGFETTSYLPTTDFQLYYSAAGPAGSINANLITYRASANEDGYFMLLLTPPLTVDAQQVIPKDVLIVLDQSGSMQGPKWSQAQAAAEFVLNHLNPQDRFNVIVFSTGYRIFANTLQSVNQASKAAAWVQTQAAEGGTDINGALLETLGMVDPTRQATVLFMTDGQPTEGVTDLPTILKNVQAKASANTRLFAFGVGDDVNTYLLDSLAADFHGASVYIRPNENLETKISGLYAKISAPVLTSPKLVFSGDVVINDTYPSDSLPDVFAGQQLIVSGRYHGQGTPTVTLSGDQSGKTQSFAFPGLTFNENAGGQPFVARLWATRKIGALLKNIQLHGQTPELVNEVVALSVRYGIITPYTSYLIQENTPGMPGTSGGDTGPTGVLNSSAPVAAAPSAQTGRAAVDAAQQSGGMAGASSVAAIPTMLPTTQQPGASGNGGGNAIGAGGNTPLRQIGDRAFVLRDGTWIDTQYTPGKAGAPAPTAITFGSDEYFTFLTAHPDLAEALALGQHVIIVVNGTAYEIKP